MALAEFIADNQLAQHAKRHKPRNRLKSQSRRASHIQGKLDELAELFGAAIEVLDEEVVDLTFPVTEQLSKITSFNFDKDPVSGVLQGIKGQYLILDHGVADYS